MIIEMSEALSGSVDLNGTKEGHWDLWGTWIIGIGKIKRILPLVNI
jgi:hypothetical protein